MRKELRVYFYTSNLEKLLQARLIFNRASLRLSHFTARREPYEEDYSLDKDDLLKRAIQQVRNEFLVRAVFFVEDTSIRVEALSEQDDFPGLRAKEWFKETDFRSLDDLLRARGNNRRAIVKSDIALHIPNLDRTFLFHGETSGSISTLAPNFNPSQQYPWLTPDTFNGWIIPDGEAVPLGALPLETSLAHDFRVKALDKLIEFIEPLNAVSNLHPSFFYQRERATLDVEQPFLPHILRPASGDETDIICLVGHKCAGKTTTAEYLRDHFGFQFFEASTVIRDLASRREEIIENSEDATLFLDRFGQDIVAREIIDEIEADSGGLHVISGFRMIEELIIVLDRFPQTKVILVEADQRIRYERHIRRGRDAFVKSFKEFQELDRIQENFGILHAPLDFCHEVVKNEESLTSLFAKLHGRLLRMLSEVSSGNGNSSPIASELYRSLSALLELDDVSTCDEISKASRKFGRAVRRYNTNRALKAHPQFAQRFETGSELLSYQITDRGKLFVELVNKARRSTAWR